MPTHVQTQVLLRLLQSSFQVNNFNLLPLSLQSALYSCPRRTSRFLEAVATTWTTMTLAYNTTNYEISCHSVRQVLCLMLWESTTPVYFAIYGCCSQRFLCHRSYGCTCLDHELELCGPDSVRAHAQLSRVYLVSTLDVTHVIKCTRLSSTLARRSWERGHSNSTTFVYPLYRLSQISSNIFPPPPSNLTACIYIECISILWRANTGYESH